MQALVVFKQSLQWYVGSTPCCAGFILNYHWAEVCYVLRSQQCQHWD